ncbi:MAG: hypothetical protein Q8S18_09150 [Bacteroidales bacterium]|jgi:hypothetical protein|nr:hypothetical protein [Bacteroidales bacterium]
MKKIVVILSIVFLAGLAITSCKSSSKCAAYGETHKFQKETRY